MKFATINTLAGPNYGVVEGDTIRLASASTRARFATLADAIAADALAVVVEDRAGETSSLAEASFLPLIPHPNKMICVGKNYARHAAESGAKPAEFPGLFPRFRETLVGHGQPMVRPRVSQDFDFEGELAIVIGKAGRHVTEADALSHVAGYTCFNDGSIRNYQFGHSLLAGKNFASTGSLGPMLTTADEIADPQSLEVVTRLNGEIVQHGHTRDMIFSCASLISYISTLMPLAPGDVIATGTPEGVGFARTPPLWLKPGDTIEVEIAGVGTLRNHVVDEAS